MNMILPTKQNRNKLIQEIKNYHQTTQEDTIYCYTWDWEDKGVSAYQLCDYAEELQNISNTSFVKRKEVYSPMTLNINNTTYYVRLESYGHSKKSKIILGLNQLAIAFNKLLYDYVYVFLEDEERAKESLKQGIEEYAEQQCYKSALGLIDSYNSFFKDKIPAKIKSRCEKGYKEQILERENSNKIPETLPVTDFEDIGIDEEEEEDQIEQEQQSKGKKQKNQKIEKINDNNRNQKKQKIIQKNKKENQNKNLQSILKIKVSNEQKLILEQQKEEKNTDNQNKNKNQKQNVNITKKQENNHKNKKQIEENKRNQKNKQENQEKQQSQTRSKSKNSKK